MPTTNAEKSILNSILNFAGGKSLTHECIDCVFYITLFDHLLENTLAVHRAGYSSVAAFPIRAILSIPSSLYRHGSAAKQHEKNSKVGNAIPIHASNSDRLPLVVASQKLQRCVNAKQPRMTRIKASAELKLALFPNSLAATLRGFTFYLADPTARLRRFTQIQIRKARHGEWSRGDASDIDGLSREAETSGNE